jgi:hypothetical protein
LTPTYPDTYTAFARCFLLFMLTANKEYTSREGKSCEEKHEGNKELWNS